jgi:hypothetical protein
VNSSALQVVTALARAVALMTSVAFISHALVIVVPYLRYRPSRAGDSGDGLGQRRKPRSTRVIRSLARPSPKGQGIASRRSLSPVSDLEPVERGSEAVPGGGQPGPRVQRERHGQAQLAEFVEDGLKTLRVVGVLRAVDRGEDVSARLGAQASRDSAGGGVAGGHLRRGFDDRVAGQQDAVIGHALATQVRDGLAGGRAVQVG